MEMGWWLVPSLIFPWLETLKASAHGEHTIQLCTLPAKPLMDSSGSAITDLQWNLSNTDTLGPIKCVLIREVSSFHGANDTCERLK